MSKPAASERTTIAMRAAQSIAEERGDTEVTTVHLLVAVMRDPNSHARVVLEDYMGSKMDPKALEELMWAHLQERPKEPFISFEGAIDKITDKQMKLKFEDKA